MSRQLDQETIANHLDPLSAEERELILALRHLILDTAPGVEESIKFNSLCYSIPDAPFGAIGGNVCMISVHEDRVSLGFIQGAGLPDPAGLLSGKGKAKREAPIRTLREVHSPAVRDLIRASLVAAVKLASDGRGRAHGGP